MMCNVKTVRQLRESPRGLAPRTDIDMEAQRAAIRSYHEKNREAHLESLRLTNTTQLMSSVARRKVLLSHLAEARRHQQLHKLDRRATPQLDLTDSKEFKLVRQDIITLMNDKMLRSARGKKPLCAKDNYEFTMGELALLRLWDY